jgi:hypothetical protein
MPVWRQVSTLRSRLDRFSTEVTRAVPLGGEGEKEEEEEKETGTIEAEIQDLLRLLKDR